MRRLLVALLLLCLAVPALAVNTGVGNRAPDKPEGTIYDGGGRTGGDNVGDAVAIASLPYFDGGNTCGYINDYDAICPYSGSTSPDVVYSYVPAANEAISVDLCASLYDTKVYIYENAVGNLVACNDDFGCGYSGWQSRLENINLTAGNTYYFIIDGYGGLCGDYTLAIEGFAPCDVVCPDGAQQEGEPPCVDNYYDGYNGGCNSVGWTLVEGQTDNCADVCGLSCTYLYQGGSYRDTDWYTMNANVAGNVTATCTAEFPLQFILIYVADCNNLQYTIGTGGPCTPVSLSWPFAAGQEFWLWVGAQVFSGVPESEYHFNVCNIAGGSTPVEQKSWGAIKNEYR
jgi:hypothetical protein